MADEVEKQITELLRGFEDRDDAADALLPLVYEHLRAIAQRRMASERGEHTLQATELVHEAYMRLFGHDRASWESRAHFFAAAAAAMRRILVDHARRRGSLKRGAGERPLPLSVVDLAVDADPGMVQALDEAVTRLEAEDPRAAEVVTLRFYAGLGVEEAAEVLGVSRRTVMREWSFARARLYQMLQPDHG